MSSNRQTLNCTEMLSHASAARLLGHFRRSTTSKVSKVFLRCTATMKAVQIETTGGAEVLKYVEIPKPVPKVGEVLVANKAIGVNYIDTYHRGGVYKIPLPAVLGREGAGVVEAIGDEVDDFQVGDRVVYFASDSYAEYTAVPSSKATKIPDGVPFDSAAAAALQGATALAFVSKAYEVKPGDKILIHAAAGGTGQILTQLAAARGAHVIATVSSEEKAAVARSLGAAEVILYSKEPFLPVVKSLTGGRGVEAVYDGVGAATFDDSLASLAPLGTLLSFGNASGPVPPVDIFKLTPNNVKLMRPSLFGFTGSKEELRGLLDEVLRLVAKGGLKIQVHKKYPLSEIQQAHKDLEGRGTTGKLLLVP